MTFYFATSFPIKFKSCGSTAKTSTPKDAKSRLHYIPRFLSWVPLKQYLSKGRAYHTACSVWTMQALSRDLFLDKKFVRVDVKEPQELLVWVKGVSGRSVISRHVPAAACTGTNIRLRESTSKAFCRKNRGGQGFCKSPATLMPSCPSSCLRGNNF